MCPANVNTSEDTSGAESVGIHHSSPLESVAAELEEEHDDLLQKGAKFSQNARSSGWSQSLADSGLVQELRQHLLPTTLPVMSQGALNQLLNIADLFFVGRYLGPEYLAAAALGNAWINQLSALFMGVGLALEDACTASFRDGKAGALGLHLQRSVVLMGGASVLMMSAITATDGVLTKLGQNVELSETASGFCDALLMGIIPLALSTACTRYLWAQGVIWPALAVDAISNVLNVSLNALLIEVDGFLGAPLATSVCRILQLVMLVGYMARWKPHASRGTWTGWAWKQAIKDKDMFSLLSACVICVARIGMETWPLEWSTLLAGHSLDVPSLDAHTVVLNTVLFCSYMVPTGMSVGAQARIPRLLAEGDARGAHRTALAAVLSSVLFSCAAGLVLVAVRGDMGDIFTTDAEVTGLVGEVATIAAIYQLLDGYQTSLAGVLRGVGYDWAPTVVLFLGWVVVGLPTAHTLAVGWGWGLNGLWVGLLAGVSAVALVFTAMWQSIDWVQAAREGHRRDTGGSTVAAAAPRIEGSGDAPGSGAPDHVSKHTTAAVSMGRAGGEESAGDGSARRQASGRRRTYSGDLEAAPLTGGRANGERASSSSSLRPRLGASSPLTSPSGSTTPTVVLGPAQGSVGVAMVSSAAATSSGLAGERQQ